MYLHDRIGQSLSALKIQLEMMASELTGSDDRKNCSRILKQIEETIHDTRVLSYELSPVILHELGLEVALGWLAEQTQKQHNLAVSFKSDTKAKQLDDSLKIILYRAVSELLHNIVKHARADTAAISIKRRNGQLHIIIEDNGVGFDPSEVKGIAATERGFGLFSIKERLHYLGGSVYITSTPNKGTRVTLIAPLKDSSRSRSG
jgi:signal transduction histidine kinase